MGSTKVNLIIRPRASVAITNIAYGKYVVSLAWGRYGCSMIRRSITRRYHKSRRRDTSPIVCHTISVLKGSRGRIVYRPVAPTYIHDIRLSCQYCPTQRICKYCSWIGSTGKPTV